MNGILRAVVVSATLVLLWAAVVAGFDIPSFVAPAPIAVFKSLAALPGFFAHHAGVTLIEAGAGALLGLLLGFCSGVVLRYGGRLASFVEPVIHATQVFPKEAMAPLFAVALGFGLAPKIVIATLICFFPLSLATARGLRAAPIEARLHLRMLGATPRETFLHCDLPYAVPFIAASLRSCTSLSVIGAVVGEFVGASAGLGYVIRGATADLAMDRMYAALLMLAVISAVLYGGAVLVEKLFLRRYTNVLEVQ